ncbi:hypothetical protein SXCC_02762 [Gluconacetobacter sp. SXCC-1]|nr:hypothetical protein SXCC_02762 [Gluconacetobacter sp. SXCC-1]
MTGCAPLAVAATDRDTGPTVVRNVVTRHDMANNVLLRYM